MTGRPRDTYLEVATTGKGLPAERGLTEHLIADGFNCPFGIGAADIAGDGDLDITVPDVWSLGYQDWRSALYWYENTGDPDAWVQHQIASGNGFLERHATGAINNDGRPDIAMGDNLHGGVFWFENAGAAPWPRHEITANLEGNGGDYTRRVSNIALADFDKDGLLDVVVGGYNEGLVALLRNPGTDAPWQQFNIEAKFSTTRMMRTGDVDGDGWQDVVASTQGGLGGVVSVGSVVSEPWALPGRYMVIANQQQ